MLTTERAFRMKAEVIPAASLYAALMIEAGFCGEYAARSRPSNSLIERER